MNDSEVQKKLNLLTKTANELVMEAQKRYGADATLFYDAGGTFNFMSSDPSGVDESRADGVELSSSGVCKMDCGGW